MYVFKLHILKAMYQAVCEGDIDLLDDLLDLAGADINMTWVRMIFKWKTE